MDMPGIPTMWICAECGKKNKPIAKVCADCGASKGDGGTASRPTDDYDKSEQ
jgi:predicted amidophosphoribosyltransferase